MSRLCFGTYAKAIQKVLKEPNANKKVTELLLGLIIDNEDITNQRGDPFTVTDKVASDLLNSKENIHKKIKAASSSERIIDAAHDYFEDAVIPEIIVNLITDLISDLTGLITSDSDIPPSKQTELLSMAKSETLTDFLSIVFLYAINKPNKLSADGNTMEVSNELALIWSDIEKLDSILSKIQRPKSIATPPEPEAHEIKYVSELLAAYADAEGIDELTKEDLLKHKKYKNDLERRRKDYYSAESIRRGARDVFGNNDSNQFDALKNETYDGIIDVHSQDFSHGYERLNSVMAQASVINVNKCLISRLPNWIGNSEKKGVCHILVNDGRLKWVTKDE